MKVLDLHSPPYKNDFARFCWWYCTTGPYVYGPKAALKSIEIAPGSTQTILYQNPPYQVELYNINFFIEAHSHPFSENLEYHISPGIIQPNTPSEYSARISPAGKPHGGKNHTLNEHNSNYLLLVLQNWIDSSVVMDHITLTNYVGPPLSNHHLNLIKERYPQFLNSSETWIDTRS